MGCRVRLWWVGGGAFVWHCGGWHHGGAHMQWVGMAGLACCVEVARFLCGRLGSWWGPHTMVGLVCGRLALWQDLHTTLGWCYGEVFTGWVGVKVGFACHVRMALEQCHGKACAL